MSDESILVRIAVLGGTGKEGKGLAYRWAKAGYRVLIGSRSSERAVTTASEIMELLEGSSSVVGPPTLKRHSKRILLSSRCPTPHTARRLRALRMYSKVNCSLM